MGQYEFPNPEWSEVSQEGGEPLLVSVLVIPVAGLTFV